MSKSNSNSGRKMPQTKRNRPEISGSGRRNIKGNSGTENTKPPNPTSETRRNNGKKDGD